MRRKLEAFTLLAVVLVMVMLAASTTASSAPLITEVYYYTHANTETEYVSIHNPTSNAIDLSSWSIYDNEYQAFFPNGSVMEAGATITVCENASQIHGVCAYYPEYSFDSYLAVGMQYAKHPPKLANTGDEVLLLDNGGQVVDAVIYGGSQYDGEGWSGAPVPGASRGKLLMRDLTAADTDTAEDWHMGREYGFGWSRFWPGDFTVDELTLFTSPESSFEVIAAEIDAASDSILLNMYSFTSPYLHERLDAALSRGVEVTLLVEGTPVGGMDSAEKWILKELEKAGADVWVMHEDIGQHIQDIYRFNHAKYMIFDGEVCLAMSENFGTGSIPLANTKGNRGWGVVMRDVGASQYLQSIFEMDSNPELDSVVRFGELGYSGSEPIDYQNVFYYNSNITSEDITSPASVSIIAAPDNAHSEILALINSAQETICIQQMYINPWGSSINPYLHAAYNASERGCSVRVVLDSSDWNGDGTADQQWTVEDINSHAKANGLDVKARLVEQYYYNHLHNKGVIVDNSSVLVSSINWNENSPCENREIGILIHSSEAAEFYATAFWYDWSVESYASSDGPAGAEMCLNYWWIICGAVIVFICALAALLKRIR
jgi:phosphatidylserine/phosphatidylglycerophosphate/cardiolipin synthase-like enzyme